MIAKVELRPDRLEIAADKALAILAQEIGLAGAACQRLDAALGTLLPLASPQDRMTVMQDLHAVDLLAQHLTALSGLAARLAASAGEGDALPLDDALQHVTLGDVARRIEAAARGHEIAPAQDEGDLDLF